MNTLQNNKGATELKITGLYGCSCHPFASWSEHNFFHKQKFHEGDIVKTRHCNQIAVIIGTPSKGNKYYRILVFPGNLGRHETVEHVSNIIPFNLFTEPEKMAIRTIFNGVTKIQNQDAKQ